MTQGVCKKCGKIIVEDLEEYRKKFPDEKYVQCQHCGAQGTFE